MSGQDLADLSRSVALKGTLASSTGVAGFLVFTGLLFWALSILEMLAIISLISIFFGGFLPTWSVVARVIGGVLAFATLMAMKIMSLPEQFALQVLALDVAAGVTFFLSVLMGGATLEVAGEGVAVTHMWATKHFAWSEVSPVLTIRADGKPVGVVLRQKSQTKSPEAHYPRSGPLKGDFALPDQYGLSPFDLAALLERYSGSRA